jgi:hypothetical protein
MIGIDQNNMDHIAMLLRGERPEGMPYEEFRLKRKAVERFLKLRKRYGSKVQSKDQNS